MNHEPPLTCDTARDLLQQHCDGELALADQPRLADHLADCPVCRSFSTRLTTLAGALDRLRTAADRAASTVSAPNAETRSPHQPPRQPPHGPALQVHWPRVAAFVGGIAALLAILISALNSFTPNPPPRTNIADAPGASPSTPPPPPGRVGLAEGHTPRP